MNPYGTPPTFSKRLLIPLEQRFGLYVEKGPDCWVWTGQTGSAGYGRFNIGNGRTLNAHRVAYEMVHGLVPEGLEVDHLCRNTRCVRVEHLEAVTPLVNLQRRVIPKKTHCIRDHDFAVYGSNEKGGKRRCKECRRIRANAQRVLKTGVRGGGLWQTLKTHCPQGHPYSAENTYVYKNGRNCRTCNNQRSKKFKRRKREPNAA